MTPKGGYSYSEQELIEQPAIELFKKLNWEHIDAMYETLGPSGTLERENQSEVILKSRFMPAIQKLNPGLPSEAYDLAFEELDRDRTRMGLPAANREVYYLLKNGVKVRIPDSDGDGDHVETVQLIDWDNHTNNDFLLISQFWIVGEMYKRRADLIGFVNGIPLLFIELKATHKQIQTAYTGNLTDYKDTVPHLFWYNAFIILSNGSEAKIGSITSEWGHFNDWKKINSEGEEGIISLETALRGTCEPTRFLDIVENFILFMEIGVGIIKVVPQNHQYLGVGNAMNALQEIKNRKGRLGVFWHTQGSGKSISMVFFSQKVLRKITGNWTFVIVTDRQELDDQIYKNFASCKAITEPHCQADSSKDLRRLLIEDHRFVFTLIHKFRTEDGSPHPVLSNRDDIIVITDEAHRSQYDTLALNMRNALPNASFLAFTGTPLIIGEEKTRDVFGDYISIYDFKQSVDDGATVPLYYENRIPELQLKDEDEFKDGMERLLEDAELDEAQEKKLEREFSREYHLITRNDRLEKIAEDIVLHFINRGQRGKGMVICIDKATAVKMYDKVKKYWAQEIDRLTSKIGRLKNTERQEVEDKVSYMRQTDMAVVVSSSQNEVAEMKKKGVDIVPHRKRIAKEDLETKFKNADDPFRLVFVCAMWMTGFDVPSCSTIYLDKPMRNHTLMQTIARANRVFRDKVNGLIVDYVGVFRDLRKALAIYGAGAGGGTTSGEEPVKPKAELVAMLRTSLAQIIQFLKEIGVEVIPIMAAKGFERVKLLDEAVDSILVNDGTKKRYINLSNTVNRIFKAILPDSEANEFLPICSLLRAIQWKIEALQPEVDVSAVMETVEELLDESITARGYIIRGEIDAFGKKKIVDLSQVDFDNLKKQFAKERKRVEIEKLRGTINATLEQMVRLNKTRINYLEKFQRMIDEYNQGAVNLQEFFDHLMKFAQDLHEEDKRKMAEELTEAELAVFDLITKPEMKLTNKDVRQVKKVARELLETLQREKLVLDWRKTQATRAAVRVTVEDKLDELPEAFTKDIYAAKCNVVYQHVFENYYGEGRSVYVSMT